MAKPAKTTEERLQAYWKRIFRLLKHQPGHCLFRFRLAEWMNLTIFEINKIARPLFEEGKLEKKTHVVYEGKVREIWKLADYVWKAIKPKEK